MNPQYAISIAQELNVKVLQVANTLALLAEGATVPFISRYRKEVTGSLDEVAVAHIRDRAEQMLELDRRREAILISLKELGKLTPELEKAVNQAGTMAVLEDIYLPYRPKRKTRASVAKEKGLEPLALELLKQENSDPLVMAQAFVNAEKQVATAEDALAGARDIIAEMINENAEVRGKLRGFFTQDSKISSKVIKGKEVEGAKYKDYFDWEEPLAPIPSHRLLAMLRGRNEDFLTFKLVGIEEKSLNLLRSHFVKAQNAAASQVELAAEDAFKRLLQVSLEVETTVAAKKKADEQAITVFAQNLRELLLASPLGHKRVLAMDPGFRTGCKIVALDAQGKFLFNHTIFPTFGGAQLERATVEVKVLCEKYEIEAIAIGNGTASRETEEFVRSLGLSIPVVMVNESGASIYSASDVAREEFPDQDVTVRGAISIGRRLLDPLAELVKIDPKSIGVGQYQHDVNQRALKQSLDDVVISCVNAVGVDVNTASKQLLTYVSGLGEKLALSMVEYRNQNGPFSSREGLKKVPKLGSKAFEQAAGFLRIPQSGNPLDASAVHPERYELVETMAHDLGCTVKDLMADKGLRDKLDLKKYVSESIGLPTLTDIMQELDKPGRDPRRQFEVFSFAPGIHELEDLQPGMSLSGIVTNVTNFGAFVDIGVHQDGLVHVSELSDTFIKDPNDFIKVQQKVQVKVLEIDLQRRRIALTMKSDATTPRAPRGSSSSDIRNSGNGRPAPARKPEPVYQHEWQRKLASYKK
jgi:uncharacterized protein